MTYDQLLTLASQGDPLVDPRCPAVYMDDVGMVFPGSLSDLRVRINEDGTFTAWVRDNSDSPDFEEPFHGDEWVNETNIENYENLVFWAYAW
jgi:hypothetical protein